MNSSPIFATPNRAISSAGSEHLPYKQGVTGSNPVSPTTFKTHLKGGFFVSKNHCKLACLVVFETKNHPCLRRGGFEGWVQGPTDLGQPEGLSRIALPELNTKAAGVVLKIGCKRLILSLSFIHVPFLHTPF